MTVGIDPQYLEDRGRLYRIKLRINDFLRRFGYELRRFYPPAPYVEALDRFGFAVNTLIDVGVGTGTQLLYDTYPAAYLVLVEPLRELEEQARRLLAARRGELHLKAAGARRETRTLHVQPDFFERSSLYDRANAEVREDPASAREIDVVPLDQLLREHHWAPPYGLKIDTEGHEEAVIRGAGELLEQTAFVVAEVSIGRRFAGGYRFGEFVRLMDEHGFEVCDIVDIGKAEDGETTFADLLFRRADRRFVTRP